MAILDLFGKKGACAPLTHVQGPLVERYRLFREFLSLNREALNLMAELEQLFLGGGAFSEGAGRGKVRDLVETCHRLTETLNRVSGGKYRLLTEGCAAIGREALSLFAAAPLSGDGALVLPLESLTSDMVACAGAKATRLAIMGNVLGMRVPRGFVVTAQGFRRFLEESRLAAPIAAMLEKVDGGSLADLEASSGKIRKLIQGSEIPGFLAEAILEAYAALEAKSRPGVRIAMRSSAVGEDSEASFAGQYLTELNVSRANLLAAYKAVVASKYSPRAISYRLRVGLADADTPMCVAGIEMIEAAASGVLYTVDPARPATGEMKISAVLGLGEQLVSGEASPDDYFVDRDASRLMRREIRCKGSRLVAGEEGGVRLEALPEEEGVVAAIDDATILALARDGRRLEEHFHGPQDVEWAMDRARNLYFLQARPLEVVKDGGETAAVVAGLAHHRLRLQGGQVACPGVATGVVFLADGRELSSLPDGAILVARTASPDYAELVGRVRGIITDLGSVASHLASVAREARVPALFNVGDATRILRHGEAVTLVSGQAAVYEGILEELAEKFTAAGSIAWDSPGRRRLRAALDLISPLNLTDIAAPDFSPEGCRTLHDIVRFAHERIVKEIFFLSEKTAGAPAVRLRANIPIVLYCIDLGGGLQQGLTTCDEVNVNHLTSIPMKALWSGFMHPAITWSGTINLDLNNLLTLMSSSAVSEFGAMPGGDSYAVISRDYMNLSVKFAYHYANLDVFCAEEEAHSGQNHILMQFSGGVGSFVGRSLRIQFLASVLGRLGFSLTVTGDLLEASFKGAPRTVMEEVLDQAGRLLASSRLLDMAIANPAQVDAMTGAFFRGEYDFLDRNGGNRLPGFYTPVGDWRVEEEEGGRLLIQDGSRWLTGLGSGFAGFMGKVVGRRYQEFLDNVRAYLHFPLAIAKESGMEDGVLAVRVQPVGGRIDQAAGLAFGLRNVGNYFVLRINALENNFILFEFVNNQRFSRAVHAVELETGRWYEIRAEVSGCRIKGYLDGVLLIEYTADWPVRGHAALWAKADSLTRFRGLSVKPDPGKSGSPGGEARPEGLPGFRGGDTPGLPAGSEGTQRRPKAVYHEGPAGLP